MKIKKTIGWTAGSIGALIVLAIAFLLIAMAMDMSITLDGYREKVDLAATKALGRNVKIDGSIKLVLSFEPALQVEGFHIANPKGWDSDAFARLDLVRARIDLLPLLKGKIQIGEITAKGVRVLFETKKDGKNNWTFDLAQDPSTHREQVTERDVGGIEFIEMREILLQDIKVTYRDGGLDDQFDFELQTLEGSAAAGKAARFTIQGDIQSTPYKLFLATGPITNLFSGKKPWPLQLSGDVLGVRMEMKGTLLLVGDVPHWTFNLVSEKIDAGKALKLFHVGQDMEGRADRFSMDLKARGRHIRELVGHSELSINLENAGIVFFDSERKKDLKIKIPKGLIQASAGKPIRMDVKGTIEEEPLTLSITGDPFDRMLIGKKPWPLRIKGQVAGMEAEADITVDLHRDIPETGIKLVFSRLDLGRILQWIEVAEGVNARVDTFQVETAFRGSDLRGLLKKSDISISMGNGKWKWQNPDTKSTITLGLKVGSILSKANEPVILNLKGQIHREYAGRTPGAGEKPLEFAVDGALHGQTRTGYLLGRSESKSGGKDDTLALNVKGKVAGSFVNIEGTLDRKGPLPVAALEFVIKPLDVGYMLHWLGIADGIKASTEGLRLKAVARGGDYRTLMERSDFSAVLEQGKWVLHDKNTKTDVPINIEKCALGAKAGEPIKLEIDGKLKNVPVKIKIASDKLAAFTGAIKRVPVAIDVEAEETHLKLTSYIHLPFNLTTAGFALSLKGKRLDNLDKLLDVSLPPMGPYSLGGQFRTTEKGYYLTDLQVKMNRSDLNGQMGLETAGQRPRLDIDLNTQQLQINDFDTGEWSAFKEDHQAGQDEEKKETTGLRPEDMEMMKPLLSPEVMTRLNFHLGVEVNNVMLGGETLGSGSVTCTLKDGRFSIDPLKLNIPGGSAAFAFAYEPTEASIMAEVSAKIDRLDYGILARKAKPETDMEGVISLDLDLRSKTKDIHQIMHQANGHLDIGVWPKGFESGVFDLWAVNLMTAVLPKVDSKPDSVINCVIARFELKDGNLRQDTLVVDTTRMRVNGEARVDFKSEDVYVYLKPTPKKPEFFSLATPIEVKGKIPNFKAGVAPGGLFGTAARFITSPLHAPIKRLFTKNLPPDGSDVCSSTSRENAGDRSPPGKTR